MATFAQKGKATVKSTEVWYLSFDVTVKGNGNSQRGRDDELRDEWKVDRSYSGVIELNLGVPTPVQVNASMSLAEIKMRMASAPEMFIHTSTDWSQNLMLIKVKIHDKRVVILKDKGEGDTFENTTTTTSWDGEGTALADNAVQLLIDMGHPLYNVTIPFQFHKDDKILKKLVVHIVDRS
ncbi:MAG: hypothetical protein ACRD43_09970, partial [Pyrinomonadaceae bacterium]